MAEKKFSGREFRAGGALVTRSLPIGERLAAMISSVGGKDLPERIQTIAGGIGKGDGQAAVAAGSAALEMISDVFVKAKPGDLSGLLKDLVELAEIRTSSGGYEPVDLDRDFSAHKKDLIPVAMWVAAEEFGDFFGGALVSGRAVPKGAH